ncbi:hypothetical protein [Paenibacillus sp. 481]|uniref:hypothetical protein n=1 Tax=Paenibacillus sp. 481 TaxID=2835869 RepID=UPI001E59EF61|nr:hypothetical protein [Paenibacillus sp. 481]UHA73438.1 MoaD/ThiS family protein [Paenibacillus sp. 481]
MKLYIMVKNPGKRKELMTQELWLNEVPNTLREMITGIVHHSVNAFKDKQAEQSLIPYLTEEDIKASANNGKVGFGTIHDDRQPDEHQAVESALLAFSDGLYRVFVNEEEIVQLDTPLVLTDGDKVVFMRFTMLAGGLW